MDVYHELPGIPPSEQPPHHYRLLGIAPFETDREVILNATRRQCGFVRTVALVYPRQSQQLLNELTAAKLCLLDPLRRREYDQQLRAAMDRGEKLAGAAPEAPSGRGNAEWIVGSGSGVHIRVRAPWVSRRHCRIWRDCDEMFVEDLKSTNGTFVNGIPVERKVALRDDDIITLGRKTRIPWPLPDDAQTMDMRIFSIGRAPDNDYIINDKSVSQHHAQIVLQGSDVILEDLDSRNGTRLGLLDNRIHRCKLEPHLSVYFGSTKVIARNLLEVVKKLS